MLCMGTVMPEIIRRVRIAKVVVADLTAHRPNVYYETGMAHAVDPDKVIIIGQVPLPSCRRTFSSRVSGTLNMETIMPASWTCGRN